MRIKAIRFEPGTFAVDMTRLDVVKQSESVRLGEDAIGVWVNNERIPWHRVQAAQYEQEPHEKQESFADVAARLTSDAQKHVTQQPAKPPKRK